MAAQANATDWTGPYIGVHAGYGWGNADTTIDSLPLGAAGGFATANAGVKPKGGTGGAQAGYNWQDNSLVFGLEADISKTKMKQTTTVTPLLLIPGVIPQPGTFTSASHNISWISTFRARLGLDVGNDLLLYGTGGVAWGNVKSSGNSWATLGGVNYPYSQSKTKTGWAIGGGMEWAFNPSTSFKVEYLYVNLGKQQAIANPVPANPPWQTLSRWKTKASILRAGFNLMF